MLTRKQEKLIRSLQTKKGRKESGLCLVEGQKLIDAAGKAVNLTFTPNDTREFSKLVTTETPQNVAGVAVIPTWSEADIAARKTILILDGVQDPGNAGAIFRLCQAFNASVVLTNSVDPTNPKTVRASAGSIFHVPWVGLGPDDIETLIHESDRPVFRLEKTKGANDVKSLASTEDIILIVGSEGSGIHLPSKGVSVAIQHDTSLESMNVGHAVAIALFSRTL